MAMRDLVAADCGGANALTKLTRHFAKDESRRLIDQGASRGQLQNEEPFSQMRPPQLQPPQTFRMDSLLQEMRNLGAASATIPPAAAPQVSELALQGENWSDEFSQSETKRARGTSVLQWANEFLQENPDLQGPDDPLQLWRPQMQGMQPPIQGMQPPMQGLQPQPLQSPLQGMQPPLHMMQPPPQLLQPPPQVFQPPLQNYDEKWAEEYLGGDVPVLSDEAVGASGGAKLAEEFADLTDEDISALREQKGARTDENQKEDYWDKLEKEWKEMATQQDHPWLSDFSDERHEEYKFKEDNPLKEHPDALEEGKRKLAEGDIPAAVLLFEAAVQQDKESVEAWHLLGTTQAKNEHDPAAIAALKNVLQLAPTGSAAAAQMALAVSYTNESYQAQACHMLQEWIRSTPDYAHLNQKGAPERNELHTYSSFMSKELHEETIEMFLGAARQNPAEQIDADVQSGLGILFNLSGEFDKATDCFRAALQVRPSDALLWNKLGATLANGDKSADAVSAYSKALEESPGYIRCRYNLGISCVNLRAYREACEHFLTALNFQAAGRGPQGEQSHSVMSENIWSSLRLCMSLMDRQDLYHDVDMRKLETLNRAFDIDSAQ